MSVFSLFDIAAEFEVMSLAIVEEQQESLEKAAQIVEKRAKEIIGHYQTDTGPFDQWRALAESTLSEKKRLGYAPPDNPLLRTGEIRESIEHTVEARRALIGSNNDIAVYQELGTHGPNPGPDGYHVPPRSFLGAAAFQKETEVEEILGDAIIEQVIFGETGIVIK